MEGGSPILERFDPGDDPDFEDGDKLTEFYENWEYYTVPDKSTQTSGYKFGQGQTDYSGGGGGWYGGKTIAEVCGGGSVNGTYGGTGYIGGVPAETRQGIIYEPSTTMGVNNGHGSALITPMQNALPSLYLGTNAISSIYFGTHEITDIKFGAQ